MNKTILFGGLAGTVLLVALFASGFGRDPQKIQSPLIGRMAPAFALQRLDGHGSVTLGSLAGRPAVVNFWATWCEPCMEEHPVLQEAARQLGERVQFVGVVYDDEPDRINDVLTRSGGASYPVLIDKGGQVAIAYGVSGVPETFFISALGRIVAKYEGPLSPDLLGEYLAKLLEARP